MARAVADIERDIRQLTERDREQLLRSLIDQLDGPPDADVGGARLCAPGVGPHTVSSRIPRRG